ncbi:hypothetical protein BS053_RS02710 [Vibrio parahaemolyticus]|nr:hypothetical protein [Vibrio parahaemolyticus]
MRRKSKLYPEQLTNLLEIIEIRCKEQGSINKAIKSLDTDMPIEYIEIYEERQTKKGNDVFLASLRYFVDCGLPIPLLFRIDFTSALVEILTTEEDLGQPQKSKIISDSLGVTLPKGGKVKTISDEKIWGEVKTLMNNKSLSEANTISEVAEKLKIPRTTVSDKYYTIEQRS